LRLSAIDYRFFPFFMLNWIFKKVVGSRNQRDLRRLQPIIRQINEIEQTLAGLSDDELRAKTAAWKQELSAIEDLNDLKKRLDEILPEAFALVKQGARRLTERKHTFTVCDQPMSWAMVHFDVQLIGGMTLHQGRIAEMATGEGKTLVGTAPVYLNALTGRGVHVVTVNDYLARRDAEWMGQLYQFLGLTVGIIQHDQPPDFRHAQYMADITYGTNSEFGFDYLRDNGMATSREQQVQRGHYFAIVDEVDSILIDEARTPLIISGPATVSTHQYDRFKPLVEQLVRKQTMYCNRLATEVKELLDAGKKEEAGRAMFKLKLGQPRSKALLRLMEEPEMRKLMEKAELEFYKDTDGKAALVALKEELFFTIEERQHDADLTEQGRNYLNPDDPNAFVLPDLLTEFADIDNEAGLSPQEKAQKKAQRQQYCDSQAERMHNIAQLLKAYCLYERDVEYVIEENKVIIVDTNTGRKMPGRRWSDGLHQAVEAKEGVQIDRETQTLATITIQNYFRLYDKLGGMTGTAETEANEFHDIYGLNLNVIPTNRKVKRIDENDRIYKTRREKYNAVIEAIKGAYAKGQPVLVGTASVEASELVGRMLKREKIPHTVLNAKYHMQEAEIVARAGMKGAVTISTNMAGRGTDIKLGEGVSELGGLYVIGTERHTSRRTDRQLRGRCARQGDPGLTRFYVSFEDDLMRNFGAADRMTKIMETFGLKEGEELEHPWLNKSVETAQKRVEQRDYQMRRRTLEFDDVMNQQREVVYGYRQEVMDAEEPRALINEVIAEAVPKRVASFLDDEEAPDYDGLLNWINMTFPLGMSREKAGLDTRTLEENSEYLTKVITDAYERKASMEHAEALKGLERYVILNAVDRLWQEHLYAMDGVREAVYLRAFAQKDPLVEYKNEAFSMFSELMDNIKFEVLSNLFRSTTNLQAFEKLLGELPLSFLGGDSFENPENSFLTAHTPPPAPSQEAAPEPQAQPEKKRIELPMKRELPTVGRNDPCPCGSGKKFKNCCGRTA
jgi:preprotein translocase subunit SecA